MSNGSATCGGEDPLGQQNPSVVRHGTIREIFDLLLNYGFGAAETFLPEDPAVWSLDPGFLGCKGQAGGHRVVGDWPGGGAALVQAFNSSVEENEEEK